MERVSKLVVLGALLLAPVVAAQDVPPELSAKAPEIPPNIQRILAPAYLTEDEKKDLRIFHGVWKNEDLDTPARRARASLIVGKLDDPSLFDPDTPLLDRAEGMLRRGELNEAIEAVEDEDSIRAVRIRAEALHGLGRFDDASEVIEPVVNTLLRSRITEASELVDGARCLILRLDIEGSNGGAAADFSSIMQILGRARNELDRNYWPALLVEGELLWAKDNRKESGQALAQAYELCARSAETKRLLGEHQVEMFSFAQAEEIAESLDSGIQFVPDEGEPVEGESPDAAIVMSLARLRQSDPDEALRELEPSLERYPKHRTLLALEAACAARAFDFDRTDRLLEEFDALSPGSGAALLKVGATLSEARQYGEAAMYLERAAAREPNNAIPVIELGLLELQSGRDVRALDALRKATALDPFNVRASNSLVLVEELLTYDTLESEHFVVRYKPETTDELLAQEMLGVLERIHARVTGDGPGGIDHEPAQKTVIELMPNHEWFAVRITGMPAIHTVAAATGPVIAMESPRDESGSSGVYDWARVVQHEYTHTVTLSRTNNRIPHWFTEAAAVYLEDSPRTYADCRLLTGAYESDGLFGLDDISVKFVRPEKRTDRAQAYAEGHWMYEYIVERWGERAPLELMDRYAQGMDESSAFRDVLDIETSEFEDDFNEWAGEQVVAWGMKLPEGVPDIRRLRLHEALRLEREGEASTKPDVGEVDLGELELPELDDVELPEPDPEMVDRWLEEYPDHPDVLDLKIDFALAETRGQPTPEMEGLLKHYARARPVDPKPHRLLAKLYLKGGALEDAAPERSIPHLEFLDARETRSPIYAIELSRRYAAMGDWDNAWDKAIRATRVAPFSASYREFAAAVALKRGDFDSAEHQVVALTMIEPDREIHQKRLERIRQMRDEG